MGEILFLFGVAGAGKNWVAERLCARFGYHFYDADLDLTPAMRRAIERRELFTDEMRAEFFSLIAARVAELRRIHPKLLVAQAAYRKTSREFLQRQIPGLILIWVRAPDRLILERLQQRDEGISPEYAAQIHRNFEPPPPSCPSIENDAGEERVVEQFQLLLEGA